ncbi:MAG: aldo/keto reductase [Clostridia bacterium]|nr:aldo/keto reductase [Clostridia bacterium]
MNINRYEHMKYRKLGKSGLKLPVISLGLWYNFGDIDDYETQRQLVLHAFNKGITHFDLANNYGPPPGSAESHFGKILAEDLKGYRDELIISTKAGYGMWPGPYGDGGSRKYLIASLNQSLKRLNLDYVDIFYHHRPDPETDLEETVLALRDIVLSGKALYVGLSNYGAEDLRQAQELLRKHHVPYVITQPSYNMLNRWIEKEQLMDVNDEKAGMIGYQVLAQGLLTSKYLKEIPKDSRALKTACEWLNTSDITEVLQMRLNQLNDLANKRQQSLSQMAIAWALRDDRMTSVLLGASKIEQLDENLKALENMNFTSEEIESIENILGGLS